MEKMQRGTIEYNSKLLEIPHYKKHPQMIPFVGRNWGKKYKKMLIIAESHYLENKDENKEIIKNWYEKPIDVLKNGDDNVCEWTSTAKLTDCTDYKSRGHRLWLNLDYAIHNQETGFHSDEKEHVFSYIAFMNFFQRPAQNTGASINPEGKDCEVANGTLKDVIKIIAPDFLFFVSNKAWQCYDKNEKVFNQNCVGHSSHPACRWWNKPSNKYKNHKTNQKATGKEAFMSFIKFNNIFA